ncbi:BRO-N domain-containing protein [Bilophila wadsworthia]|uniref:BRO-N domain-containing protein n=1 Tax=Bilophila wadsworthia TaxID=35833 RepID=UPI00266F4232|nr:BRO family protein [Bilophila wadsworthia]
MKMSNITPFAFGDNLVRSMTDENGNPWFVAKDVAVVLDIQNIRQNLSELDDDEKGVCTTYTPGGAQELKTVSESGLYALVFRSRKPEAKAFSKWVRSEVLPALRKTGNYVTPGAVEMLSASPDVDELRNEESTDATRRLAENFPSLSQRFINRACELAIQIGVTDTDKMYELYICYCKIFHTREHLNSIEEFTNLDLDIIDRIWREVRSCEACTNEKKRIQSFLQLTKVVEKILDETKSVRLEAAAKKALQEYISAVLPEDIPHHIEVSVNAGK